MRSSWCVETTLVCFCEASSNQKRHLQLGEVSLSAELGSKIPLAAHICEFPTEELRKRRGVVMMKEFLNVRGKVLNI